MTIPEIAAEVPGVFKAEHDRQKALGAPVDRRQCWIAVVRYVIAQHEKNQEHEPFRLGRVRR